MLRVVPIRLELNWIYSLFILECSDGKIRIFTMSAACTVEFSFFPPLEFLDEFACNVPQLFGYFLSPAEI